jgi:nicotinamide-nucleotide amidase
MRCSIIAIGTEVVTGDIQNTNAHYIANYLKKFGIEIVSHIAVLDNEKDIIRAIKKSFKNADLIITTGGLGPTYDDITKKAIAQAIDKKLVLDEQSLEKLKQFFIKINKPMSKNNEQQCYFPKDSIIIDNPNGTAPACIATSKKGSVIMLPGPPIEMQPLLEAKEILDFLNKGKKCEIVEKMLNIFGIGESSLEEKLGELMAYSDDLILAPYAKTGEVALKITAKGETKEIAQQKSDELKNKIYDLVGEHIYSENNENIEEVIIKKAKEKNIKLITVESCTGGLVSQKLTSVAGSSTVFLGGLITYSDEFKIKLCNVKEETLKTFGAVSNGVAIEMVEGALQLYNADIAVSVTGIAGPGGETEDKPVGLVYIGIATKEKACANRFNFIGNREKIRELSAKNALFMVYQQLKEWQ